MQVDAALVRNADVGAAMAVVGNSHQRAILGNCNRGDAVGDVTLGGCRHLEDLKALGLGLHGLGLGGVGLVGCACRSSGERERDKYR